MVPPAPMRLSTLDTIGCGRFRGGTLSAPTVDGIGEGNEVAVPVELLEFGLGAASTGNNRAGRYGPKGLKMTSSARIAASIFGAAILVRRPG